MSLVQMNWTLYRLWRETEFFKDKFREVILYAYFKIKRITASNCTFLFIGHNWNLDNELRCRYQIKISKV